MSYREQVQFFYPDAWVRRVGCHSGWNYLCRTLTKRGQGILGFGGNPEEAWLWAYERIGNTSPFCPAWYEHRPGCSALEAMFNATWARIDAENRRLFEARP